MIPDGIKEEDFRYKKLPSEIVYEFYLDFMDLLEGFSCIVNVSGRLEVNLPIIGRICARVDQRKDYYMYYHSEDGKVMRMSHEKELGLWAYWVCKYKPVRFAEKSDDELFFLQNGCAVSDAFAAYIIISIVCANNAQKANYFTDKVISDLYYDLANRDFSKEAIISRINDLIH